MSAPLAGRTVVVTGAGGFIGPYVVAELIRSGARVRAIVARPGEPARDLPSGAETSTADVTDLAATCEAVRGADIVVHMAGGASVRASLVDADVTHQTHVTGTGNALEASRLAHAQRFIYMSSAEVYGRPPSSPVAEDHPLVPRSPYGHAKAAAERAVREWSLRHAISSVVLRPFSVYGPGAAAESLVGSIARQAAAGGAIVVADMRPVRDFVFVTDVADAVTRACIAEVDGCVVANIGSGKGTRVADVARMMGDLTMHHPEVVEDASLRRPEAVEIFELIADVRAAKALLGWTASTPLSAGLARVLGANAPLQPGRDSPR